MDSFFSFWSMWVVILTSVNLILLFWVLMANRKVAIDDDADPEDKTTGHIYDGIEEYDNPLPKWWFQLFIATFIFAIGYLIVYPGYGSFKGVIGWTAVNQLENEQKKANEQYGEVFAKNIGEETPIGLARGLNAQWTNGGLLYSPPFR